MQYIHRTVDVNHYYSNIVTQQHGSKIWNMVVPAWFGVDTCGNRQENDIIPMGLPKHYERYELYSTSRKGLRLHYNPIVVNFVYLTHKQECSSI